MTYEVKVDVSPVYELLGSFMVYITNRWVNNMDLGPEWIEEINTRLSIEVRSNYAVAAAWPFSDYDVLYLWTIHRKDDYRVIEFLDFIDNCSLDYLYTLALPYIPSNTIEDTDRIRKDYIPLLRAWYNDYYQSFEEQYDTLLEDDAAEKQILQDKMDPEALIEYATGGVVIDEQLPINKVIILPTVHFKPISTYCFYQNMLMIQYPIDLPETDEDEPPTILLRMTRALAAPQRLRLLRYVADEPKSLQEMTQYLGDSKEVLMHHLMLLRVAGLLRVHLQDEDKEKFSIRPDGAAELQMFLESYIRLT